ncbi:5'-nucleotidase C-terminal domain-containing protein [Afifella sp. H1R]|uniref:bifunctional metallophosphatase/5'-nucleotidase n=1 Tax=Afifella sp. H1R TaxID=2908841 RepID=UPI001F3C7EEA|nr:5'-nucleotidase C-terminal domain-containing protein [Afifella sp. H1R]MCF1505330.1 5'-nucleotidase C-terminal domain-containing protein [Afifella sp. H1R]
MASTLRWFAAFVIAVSLAPSFAAAEDVSVTFLLVNDADQMAGSDDVRGGYARIGAVVARERAERDHVIFAHAGDAISPSLMAGFDEGAHIITLLNIIKPDVFVPGNHEYDFGPAVFARRMGEAEFPVLAANLRDQDGKRIGAIADTRMIEAEGVKIGIVGLTAEDSYQKSSPGTLKIAPALATGEDAAEALRAKGADFLVAVAHAGREVDRALIQSRAFDLILSGDDHDLMIFFDGKTAMAESKEQGEYVIAVDVRMGIEEKGGARRLSWWPEFRPIDTAGVIGDSAVQAKIDEFQADLSKELDVGVGTTKTTLDSRRATLRTGEAAIGNLVADAMRAGTAADVAITNGGGIRGNRIYEPGATITRRDILTELPFGNVTVKLEISGAAIREALEHGFGDVENASGRFPQISGMRVTVDLKKPAGERVEAVEIDGKPLDPGAVYTLATNDFMADGGDGYVALTKGHALINGRDGRLIANDVMAFVRSAREVAPRPEGRITFLEHDAAREGDAALEDDAGRAVKD